MPRSYVRSQTFPADTARSADRAVRISDCAPSLVMIGVSVVAALAIAVGYGGAVGMTLHAFIGFFLCVSAASRLPDLRGFAHGFSRFDLIARRWRGYGFVFPFLELGLGLAYFAFIAPAQVYVATAVVFTLALAGVLSARHRGLDLASQSQRTGRGAPLGIVMLIEAALMTALAMVLMWL